MGEHLPGACYRQLRRGSHTLRNWTLRSHRWQIGGAISSHLWICTIGDCLEWESREDNRYQDYSHADQEHAHDNSHGDIRKGRGRRRKGLGSCRFSVALRIRGKVFVVCHRASSRLHTILRASEMETRRSCSPDSFAATWRMASAASGSTLSPARLFSVCITILSTMFNTANYTATYS